ncbi:hypothetical protein L207DRAFT_519965 [Hyaloscypha variabilis F]|uniref:Fungal N-terminal domain-containing protein n=1 Tax=Hyaloscypha variabilis (strain UAMH 11265 / GT02V1 / F) TaxID=1149755 RepID=A0A2J6QX57_HYAVF|nr:hypothetical protein L207DRAFT_519965 [Hyaloscypha variabilis F]
MDLASSIAGLVGLAGLAVQSASTLYVFCRKVPRVAAEVEAVIDEVEKLKQTLESIQEMVSDRKILKPSSRTSGVITKLEEELTRCAVDVEAWNTCMAALKIDDGKWAKNALKTLKLAADGGRFSETRLKISSHRGQLTLLVDLLTVDLEMSTNLGIQTIESKVDNFSSEQANSHRLSVSHLEQIRDGVHAAATLQTQSLANTKEISESTTKIHETLHDIWLAQTSSQQTTHLQLERLDANIAAMQRSLLGMPPTSRTRPKPRRISRKQHQANRGQAGFHRNGSVPGLPSEMVHDTNNPPTNPAQLTRLVDLAVTVRHRAGKAHFEALAVPDPEFEAAGFKTKLQMVKYLQDLRLMLWLLCRKQRNDLRIVMPGSTDQSRLMPEAGLVSSWTIWMTLSMTAGGYEPQFNHSHLDLLLYLVRCVQESMREEYSVDGLRISHKTTSIIHVITLRSARRRLALHLVKSLRSTTWQSLGTMYQFF